MIDPIVGEQSSVRRSGSGGRTGALTERLGAFLLKAPLIILSTMLLGTVSLAGSFADSGGGFQHWCARKWARLVLVLAGVRLHVGGLERLRPPGRYIFCANHQSDMDIPVLLAALPFQFRFAAKKSLFSVPFLGWHLRRAGHVPIDRENPRAAVRALDRSAHWIRAGLPLVVFPEGRVSQDGSLGEFRRGAFVLAARTQANLVPVAIRGTRDILRPSSWFVRGGAVEVTVGAPVGPHSMPIDELRSAVRRQILSGSRPPGGAPQAETTLGQQMP